MDSILPLFPLQSIAASTPGLKYLTSEAELLSEDSQSPSAFSRHVRMKRRSTSMTEERGTPRGRRPQRLLTTRERNASRKKLGFAIEVRN